MSPEEDHETEDVEVNEPKGREEAVASSETGGSGAFMQIGAATSSAKGDHGNRDGGGKRRSLGAVGGTRQSEASVDRSALRWFKRHQNPNGMWDIDGYPNNCDGALGVKCEPGRDVGADGDAAAPGYAILAFLGAGHDHIRRRTNSVKPWRGVSIGWWPTRRPMEASARAAITKTASHHGPGRSLRHDP